MPAEPPARPANKPLTVSELTAKLRRMIEDGFARVNVVGEISNWSVPSSGHAYFSLKDEGAALSCVCWRGTREGFAFAPADGQKVECAGKITVYDKRGQYQLVVDSMRLAGEGELWRKFVELKARLEREGLFATERKRPVPRFPRAIGVVTSPTGAVIRDICKTLERRAPWLPIYIWPARMQGEEAAREIARGVAAMGESGLVDLLVVARGGGSLEDLMPFNTEEVARAVVGCRVPVISGVGHETDFTICDFSADLRAATPTAAAELASAGYVEAAQQLSRARRMLDRTLTDRLTGARQRVTALMRSHDLRFPETRLRQAQQNLDQVARRLDEAMRRELETARRRLDAARGALGGHDPELILQKGYAIVRTARDGRVIREPKKLRDGELVNAKVALGEFSARVVASDHPDLFYDEKP